LRTVVGRRQAKGRHKGAYGNRFKLQHAMSGLPEIQLESGSFITFDKGFIRSMNALQKTMKAVGWNLYTNKNE
jgi:hypothetical protein